MMLAALKSLQT